MTVPVEADSPTPQKPILELTDVEAAALLREHEKQMPTGKPVEPADDDPFSTQDID